MKLDAQYGVYPEDPPRGFERMVELVAKAESLILEAWSPKHPSQIESLQCFVEMTDYSDDDFGIRIFIHKQICLRLKSPQGVTQFEFGKGWTMFTFSDKTSIQFVHKSAVTLPKTLDH